MAGASQGPEKSPDPTPLTEFKKPDDFYFSFGSKTQPEQVWLLRLVCPVP